MPFTTDPLLKYLQLPVYSFSRRVVYSLGVGGRGRAKVEKKRMLFLSIGPPSALSTP